MELVLSLLEGSSQSATAGQQVATRPAVRVSTSTGTAARGVTVTFAVASGGGTVTGATQTTDESGVARVGGWTLGNSAGQNSLTASAQVNQGSPVTFEAAGTAGPAAVVTKQEGDASTATAGSATTARPAVKVTDQHNNAIAGIGVTFAITQGGGTLTGATPTTGANGVATVGGWTLGQTAGPNAVSATIPGAGVTGNPATFTATGTVGPPATITKQAGDNQSVAVGRSVLVAPSVRVADQFGNLIVNQLVTFAVLAGGGAVTGATPNTNASGIATVGSWTLGNAAGANTLTASTAGLSVTFTATSFALLDPQQYAGTYAGTWTNTTFASTGTGTATISVDAVASTVTVTASATGSVLGGNGVAPTTRGGAYGETSASFQGVVPPMGTINGTIDANGNITASGTNVPNPGIARWDATGTLTASQLRLNFTVTFTAGAPATGSITLNRQ